jgi:23S rRNA (uridine2552-2'-O)-methyltransferase
MLRPGQRVADLGCWPGGWLQVAAQAVGPRGRVVGVDLAELEPPLDVPHVVTLRADLAEAATGPAIVEALGGRAAVVLCDAAPKLTGVRATDRAREEALLETVEALLPAILAPGGDLLLKLLESPEAQAIAKRIGARFERSRILRPKATRKGSSEKYLFGRGYRE